VKPSTKAVNSSFAEARRKAVRVPTEGREEVFFLLSRYGVLDWPVEAYRTLRLEEIDVRYARYRLSVLEAEETMARSLRRYGQISPVVVCLREEVPVLVDGFKRLAAARGLKGFGTLSARRIWPASQLLYLCRHSKPNRQDVRSGPAIGTPTGVPTMSRVSADR
jgi:hypothetical protein